MESKINPKVFISYSWTSKEHSQQVLELATSLVEIGVAIIIDKWDLPEGEDKYEFMERIVNDKSVDKVLIISDKKYATKADNREGGVGTETQIITPKLYEKFSVGEQKTRFVALVYENDEKGKPCLPTYFKNRIYIDFSDDELRSTNFEQLVRWIYDKPLHKKPPLGTPPSYILEEPFISLNTQGKLKILMDSFRFNPISSKGALSDYLDTFITNLDRFNLSYNNEENFYELVVANIKQFLPFRNEFIDVSISALNYIDEESYYTIYHQFFENIFKLILCPKHTNKGLDITKDNYRYFIQEMFVYCIATLLKKHKFHLANEILANDFYISDTDDFETGLHPYGIFNAHIESFTKASKIHRRISYTADQLVNNATHKKINLTDFMQSDFLLYIRSEITSTSYSRRWYPHSGIFIASRQPKFELFLRSESKAFFDRFKFCLGVSDLEELKQVANDYRDRKRHNLYFETDSIYPPAFMNINNLCTRP